MSRENVRENFIYNAVCQLLGIIVPIITLPYLTRTIYAQGLGVYSFAFSVATYFSLFIRLGLSNYGNRTIAFVKDDNAKLSQTFWDIFVFQVFMGIVISLLYCLYCALWAPDKVLAYIFLLLIFSGAIDVTWALYGLEEFRVTAWRDVLVKILTTICIFVFVKTTDDVWKYAVIYCLGLLILNIVSIPLLLKRVHIVKPNFAGVISHIKPNLLLFLPTIAVSIYKVMDKIMLGAMANEKELGYYHSCENIIMVPLALITALGTVMLPRMSNMISQGKEDNDFFGVFDKSITFAMFISTSMCIGIMTVSKEFVSIFFGNGFEKCILLLQIILPSCIFLAFANVIRTQYLLPRKKDGIYIVSLFCGAISNILLNLVFIPKYGSVGAAIGTLAAEAIVCMVQAASVFKDANIINNIVNSIPFIISGIVMYALGYNMGFDFIDVYISLICKVIICALIYLISLAVLLNVKKLFYRIKMCWFKKDIL